ncbi:Ig-like domain-containing protein [Clostridium estertheticum]|uniref:Ig-like domain-containing protein n=1 Tax=Clostridium estertheticum TaxID=238834 RepID=UPI001C7D21E2|nr:Ig-like domain-containing protein [Clostridium estertheticum]MBX4263958.1 Ig-like domain-containing protein [Clostridium estertheticum]WLC87071.1 Ig-like domain-containing protein [Clostridium estertheticum]
MITKHKIITVKNLLVIFTIALLYQIQVSVYNTRAAVNLSAISPTTVTTSQGNQTLIVGGPTLSLKATVLPANAANKAVVWSSSNEDVATVSASGIVTPIGEGTAMIVVKTVDGGHIDTCIVKVTKSDVAGMTLTPNMVTLKIKGTTTLTPKIFPLDASNKTVIWYSGNEDVAKVSDKGVVTAITPGSAGIIGKTVDGEYRVYCLIYVPEEVNSITLSQNNVKFALGDTPITISAKIMPDNLSMKSITWTSSNYGIANVDSNGRVTPMSGGSATITATSTYDKTKKATCNVTVNGLITDTKVHATGITLKPKQLDLRDGTPYTLTQVITPTNAVNKAVIWSSSNESVATVSDKGVVTPIATGTTLIVVTTVDRGNMDGCVVNVTKKDVTGMTLINNYATLKIKSTLTLKPEIVPSKATNQTVIWSSGNEDVAKVSDTGIVTAITSGSAGIIGRTVDGDHLVYCLVYVPEVIDNITLSQNSLKFDLGGAATVLSAKIMPDNLSLKDITWTSSNYNIADVDSNGRVIPKAGGNAIITATSVYDKTKKATCSVTVNGPITDTKIHATGITLNEHSRDLIGNTPFTLKPVISPSNAVNKAVTWSSSNENVATVSATGVVTPIAEGITLIAVTTVDRGNMDGCLVNVTKQNVTGMTLTKNYETLKIKSTLTLKPDIFPVNASNKAVIWSSGNEEVAKISDTGVVTAISSGSAGIIGKTVDGNYLVYCLVYVPEVIDSISLNQNSLKFKLGDAAVSLSAKIMPDNLSVKGVVWTSSNYGIANVDSNGKVAPMSGGSAVITATSVYDKTKKATCSVNVIGPVSGDLKVHATSISIKPNANPSIVGTPFTLTTVINPSNAVNKAVTWSSSNENIAVVSATGVVTPIAEGVTLIIATTVDRGIMDACVVNVTKQDIAKMTLNKNSATLKIKSTLALKPDILPTNASNKTIIWSSGNEDVASVSDDGIVTAIKAGTAGIIGRSVEGNHLVYCIVYVPEQVDNIILNQNSLKFKLGDSSVNLSAVVMPENQKVKRVTWTSSNPMVANVDSNGRVTPTSGGTTTITATSMDDTTKKATCSVTVLQPTTGVIIN